MEIQYLMGEVLLSLIFPVEYIQVLAADVTPEVAGR
jgi:hypothetical protein